MLEASTIPRQDRSLHVLNRLAFGPRPGDLERVDSVGADRWVQQQLHPESIEIPQVFIDQIRTYSTLHMSPVDLFVEYQKPLMQARREAKQAGGDKADLKGATKDERLKERVVMREAVEARLYRAIFGPRQLQEVMTAFWFNHFNIFAGKGLDMVWTGAFEEQAIRPHTMGRFRDLLGATAHHPAMLFYLDNWQNTAPNSPGAKGKFDGINENYARELMELHTLGVNGGYSQQDVIALAHILTGWGLPPGRGGGGGGGGMRRAQTDQQMFPPGLMPRGFGFLFRRRQMAREGQMPARVDPSGFHFDASRHDPGPKYFLGQTIEGAGEHEGEEALDILARSPQTAKHLSFQLAQYFVADNAPPALVHRMSQRYLATDGDIRAVLELMFTSSEFWDPRYYAAKFKTPYEYVVSSVRATAVPVINFRPLYGTIQLLGMPLYGCQTPNGYDMTQEAWLNPDAMMTRLSFATALANGNLPLLNPPFEEEDGASGPSVVSKNGRYKGVNFGGANHVKMDPVDPAAVTSAMGGGLSPNTANAVETAPPQLRAALVLGSPEFMKR